VVELRERGQHTFQFAGGRVVDWFRRRPQRDAQRVQVSSQREVVVLLACEPRSVGVILSVGLARAFQASGDTARRHWLQVNNLHLEDDPVWKPTDEQKAFETAQLRLSRRTK